MNNRTRRFVGAGLLGLSLTAGLAACATTLEDAAQADEIVETQTTTQSDSTTTTDESTETEAVSTSIYLDGEYTATGSYTTPGGQESVTVTLTLAHDVVTAVSVDGSAESGSSLRYQSEFIENIASQVVGVSVDDLNVSKVAGSSLTSSGFNAAVDEILAAAQA